MHQGFELLCQRGFTTANRPQQIEDLLLLFQALSRVLEIGDNLFDGLFHAVEIFEGGIACHDAVGEKATESGVDRGVDHFRFADGDQQTLGGGGVAGFVLLTHIQKFLDGVFLFPGFLISLLIMLEDAHNFALVIVAYPEKSGSLLLFCLPH